MKRYYVHRDHEDTYRPRLFIGDHTEPGTGLLHEHKVMEFTNTNNIQLADYVCAFLNGEIDHQLTELDRFVSNTRMHSPYRLKIQEYITEIRKLCEV